MKSEGVWWEVVCVQGSVRVEISEALNTNERRDATLQRAEIECGVGMGRVKGEGSEARRASSNALV